VTKQSFLGRVEQLSRGDAPDGEDPLLAVDRALREHAAAIGRTQEDLVEATDVLHDLQGELDDASEAAGEWGAKAVSMQRRSDETRVAGGHDLEVVRLAQMAVSAGEQQRRYEQEASALRVRLESQQQAVAMTRATLCGLQDRYDELAALRRTVAARGTSA
jgi:phage shock protein A